METETTPHITINIESLIKIGTDVDKGVTEISDTLKNKIKEAIKEILKDVL